VNKIYTIGYGGRSLASIKDQLLQEGIQTLIDVRSNPYSRWNFEFNIDRLKETAAPLKYDWRGYFLGGFVAPADYPEKIHGRKQECKRIAGMVVGEGAKIALMCAEENPDKCHRKQDLAPIFKDLGIEVIHLRSPQGVEKESQIKMI